MDTEGATLAGSGRTPTKGGSQQEKPEPSPDKAAGRSQPGQEGAQQQADLQDSLLRAADKDPGLAAAIPQLMHLLALAQSGALGEAAMGPPVTTMVSNGQEELSFGGLASGSGTPVVAQASFSTAGYGRLPSTAAGSGARAAATPYSSEAGIRQRGGGEASRKNEHEA